MFAESVKMKQKEEKLNFAAGRVIEKRMEQLEMINEELTREKTQLTDQNRYQ